jgi:hypothetical protein
MYGLAPGVPRIWDGASKPYRPLLIIVDPLEQMGLTSWHSCWHCNPASGQRFSSPTWWPHQPRGEGRLGHVSHNLRHFLIRRPLAGFDELNDESVCVHHSLL